MKLSDKASAAARLRRIASTLEAGGTVDGSDAAVVMEVMFNHGRGRRIPTKRIPGLLRERAALVETPDAG